MGRQKSLYPFEIMVANEYPNEWKAVELFGKNTSVGNSFELVSSNNANLDIPSSKVTTVDVFSSDGNDTSDGTGARTIEIKYLDDSYDEQTKTITMNGATKVEWSSADFFRFLSACVMTAGSGNSNAGNISITNSDQSETYGYIAAGDDRSGSLLYTIPNGYNGYIGGWTVTGGSYDDACLVQLEIEMDHSHNKIADIYTVWRAAHVAGMSSDYSYFSAIKIPEKTTLRARAKAATGSETVTVSSNIIIVKEGYET